MVAPRLLRRNSRSRAVAPGRVGRRRRTASRGAGRGAIAALGLIAALCLVAAGTPAAGADAGTAGTLAPTLESPLAPFHVARLFDRPDAPWAAGHRGIDVLATQGEQVGSPGAGVVAFAGTVVDRGVVTVDHGGGLVSSVEPITATVAVGDRVEAGDPLGVVSGEPGHCAPRTCVHWGVRFHGEYVNPLDVLAGYGRIVLLP